MPMPVPTREVLCRKGGLCLESGKGEVPHRAASAKESLKNTGWAFRELGLQNNHQDLTSQVN